MSAPTSYADRELAHPPSMLERNAPYICLCAARCCQKRWWHIGFGYHLKGEWGQAVGEHRKGLIGLRTFFLTIFMILTAVAATADEFDPQLIERQLVLKRGADPEDAALAAHLSETAMQLYETASAGAKASPNPMAPVVSTMVNSPEISLSTLIVRINEQRRKEYLKISRVGISDEDAALASERIQALDELISTLSEVAHYAKSDIAAQKQEDVAEDEECVEPPADVDPVDTPSCLKPGESVGDAICRIRCEKTAEKLAELEQLVTRQAQYFEDTQIEIQDKEELARVFAMLLSESKTEATQIKAVIAQHTTELSKASTASERSAIAEKIGRLAGIRDALASRSVSYAADQTKADKSVGQLKEGLKSVGKRLDEARTAAFTARAELELCLRSCVEEGMRSGEQFTLLNRFTQPMPQAVIRLSKSSFKPGEAITGSYTSSKKLDRDAWFGVIPATVPHGSEEQADQHDLKRLTVGNAEGSRPFSLSVTLESGLYTLRMFDDDDAGQEVVSVPFRVAQDSTKPGKIDLSGLWVSKDYQCEGKYWTETVRIQHFGDDIVGVKVTGDACVPAGAITFKGQTTTNIQCRVGNPDDPANSYVSGLILFVKNDSFKICGHEFIRAE